MSPCKALGPDGFSADFYQKTWDVVSGSLTEFAMNFFKEGRLPPGYNDTILTLLPKVPSLESIKQFRPIGLCNVTYKLLTKTMAMRLREVSKKLVGPHQTSFVPGR